MLLVAGIRETWNTERLSADHARDLPDRAVKKGRTTSVNSCFGTRTCPTEQKGSSLPIYSDSRNAIGWVKKKKCKTLLERVPENEPIFDMIERAEKWLKTNTYTTPILKWETSEWGEIPADFGRK